MKYDLELDNGLMISGANKQSWTTYYDDFLPVTATEHPELETRIFSFAPILEKEAPSRYAASSKSFGIPR